MTTPQHDPAFDPRGSRMPLTPPPAAGAEVPPGAAEPPTGGSGGPARGPGVAAILVTTAVVGGIALLGSGATAAVAATGTMLSTSGERGDSVQTVDAEGITSIDLDVDAGNMRVEFGDVVEAELSVTNSRNPGWTLEREGDELVVRSPDFEWGWWFGGWFGDDQSAVLTLPEDLSTDAVDADLTLDAGSLDVVGDFGALDLTVNAGALDVEGAAESLAVEMSAGRADVALDGVDQADLSVSAGDMNVVLGGTAPSSTTIDVSAGSLDLTVPDTSYAIGEDVSAGSLNAKVDRDADSSRTIDVSLSAGSVTIRPGA
ncbi:DUF4097 family beta strand repeat-containing protein [Microbacterium hydrocarbonoxydans]|uniref:DUF4097 family beta strand repeat-containing protein n=1 Tax=Microbacterium hydrocarbonoxydans TaxID=273678 RepID=UPI00203B7889|nr:DUF4097 family beta strand repeat-containing protein [Microbacterium hydrocarbonoxydans]MCM3778634.1 DUF4097 domain-containing protein [Microbacterium hydrocarbonoxydans]